MRRVAGFVWHWRWFLAVGLIIAVIAGSYLHWRSEQAWVNGLLVQGEEALAAREYEAARQHFYTYLESRPHDTRARLLAARAARWVRQYDDAAENLRKCREDGGDTEAIDAEYALIAVERGNATAVPELR